MHYVENFASVNFAPAALFLLTLPCLHQFYRFRRSGFITLVSCRKKIWGAIQRKHISASEWFPEIKTNYISIEEENVSILMYNWALNSSYFPSTIPDEECLPPDGKNYQSYWKSVFNEKWQVSDWWLKYNKEFWLICINNSYQMLQLNDEHKFHSQKIMEVTIPALSPLFSTMKPFI